MSDGPTTRIALLLVAGGGFLGTLARYAIVEVMPAPSGWPFVTLLVNLVGAFALGLLIQGVASGNTDSPRRRALRLLAGTGFLGSFTTYSAFAVETERLLAEGLAGIAAGYVAASLLGGLAACVGGVVIAARWRTQRIDA